MSTIWTVYCGTCHIKGPSMRRSAGYTALSSQQKRAVGEFAFGEASKQWTTFLLDHEACSYGQEDEDDGVGSVFLLSEYSAWQGDLSSESVHSYQDHVSNYEEEMK